MKEACAMKAVGSDTSFRLVLMAFRLLCLVVLSQCVLFRTEVHARFNQDVTTATLSWTVVVPENTPPNAELYMAGNQDALGPWQPNAYRLKRLSPREFECQLKVPIGTEIEYKFTRGSWGTVEKTKDGAEIANRRLRATRDSKLTVEIEGWAKPAVSKPNTGTGNLRWMDIDSKILNGKRRVTVWLPRDYRDHCMLRYATLYFLDGQNVFDASRAAFGVEWKADETVRQLMDDKRIRPSIVVAIDNSPDRLSEYSPVTTELNQKNVGGDADRYLKFLCEEVKPWIDREFRTIDTPDHTAIIGSSMGGLFVLHALRTRNDVFGAGVAMSPSLFWGAEHTLHAYREWGAVGPRLSDSSNTTRPTAMRLWLDIGQQEGKNESTQRETVEMVQRFESVLRGALAKTIDARLIIDPEGQHNESAWAKRLPDALQFVMPEMVVSD
jgi:predicted alpha/beta superfamily hydrolase